MERKVGPRKIPVKGTYKNFLYKKGEVKCQRMWLAPLLDAIMFDTDSMSLLDFTNSEWVADQPNLHYTISLKIQPKKPFSFSPPCFYGSSCPKEDLIDEVDCKSGMAPLFLKSLLLLDRACA